MVHAVAHVMEMQGRLDDGTAWLRQHQPVWAEGNGFHCHLWWHLGLFRLEGLDTTGVLRWDPTLNRWQPAGNGLPNTRIMALKASPNFEAFAGDNGNNIYAFTVVASDGVHNTAKDVTVNLIDVETAKILVSFDQEASSARELRQACKTLAGRLSGEKK